MPTYRYTNPYGKPMYRASTVDVVMGKKPDGTDQIVRQPGPMQQVAAGTLLDDVQEHELAAFPDMFELVDEEELKAAQEAYQKAVEAGEISPLPTMMMPGRGVHEPASGPDAMVQKPALTGMEVAAAKAAQVETRKLERQQAAQMAEMQREKEAAQQKAMNETMQEQAKAQQHAAEAEKAKDEGQPASHGRRHSS